MHKVLKRLGFFVIIDQFGYHYLSEKLFLVRLKVPETLEVITEKAT